MLDPDKPLPDESPPSWGVKGEQNATLGSCSPQTVFISDLHLHPDCPEIQRRFDAWVEWAAKHAQIVYILGDFFHVWAGDDTLDAWSESIAGQLAGLSAQGITVYFMPGNRDFLLGQRFIERARLCAIREPHVIQLDEWRVLLVHGDGYCLQDKSHQRFRWLTRKSWFKRCFLALPKRWRVALVSGVRRYSQVNHLNASVTDILPETLLQDVRRYHVDVIIHGHIHRPAITVLAIEGVSFQQIVLSDWDDIPGILCYNKTNKFYFYKDFM